MTEMAAWQWAVVGGVALLSVGRMIVALLGLSSRRAGGRAAWRQASPFESALVAGRAGDGQRGFDAFSYRVGARFAGRVRIVVDGDSVAVAGPRVPSGLYLAWLWVQGLLLALVPAALAWALVRPDWRPALLGGGLFLLSLAISSLGAGLWPGLGEMEFLQNGRFKALEFDRALVRDVAVGEGWARGGLEVVLLPYKKGIDALAERRAVSFFAPDERGRQVRFALHMSSDQDAEQLAALLQRSA